MLLLREEQLGDRTKDNVKILKNSYYPYSRRRSMLMENKNEMKKLEVHNIP
jgi:hypothetical protein